MSVVGLLSQVLGLIRPSVRPSMRIPCGVGLAHSQRNAEFVTSTATFACGSRHLTCVPSPVLPAEPRIAGTSLPSFVNPSLAPALRIPSSLAESPSPLPPYRVPVAMYTMSMSRSRPRSRGAACHRPAAAAAVAVATAAVEQQLAEGDPCGELLLEACRALFGALFEGLRHLGEERGGPLRVGGGRVVFGGARACGGRH
jgi:hypothetical protein